MGRERLWQQLPNCEADIEESMAYECGVYLQWPVCGLHVTEGNICAWLRRKEGWDGKEGGVKERL